MERITAAVTPYVAIIAAFAVIHAPCGGGYRWGSSSQ